VSTGTPVDGVPLQGVASGFALPFVAGARLLIHDDATAAFVGFKPGCAVRFLCRTLGHFASPQQFNAMPVALLKGGESFILGTLQILGLYNAATCLMRAAAPPVPAGISRPTMTFSFRPRACRACRAPRLR
jgi:hypothetical protein